jgi:hypothetical protein
MTVTTKRGSFGSSSMETTMPTKYSPQAKLTTITAFPRHYLLVNVAMHKAGSDRMLPRSSFRATG